MLYVGPIGHSCKPEVVVTHAQGHDVVGKAQRNVGTLCCIDSKRPWAAVFIDPQSMTDTASVWDQSGITFTYL